MAWLLSLLLFFAPVAAANNDDNGFIWVDANTKIKVKPIGKAAGSAATGDTRAPEPEPKKDRKEKPKK